MSEDVTAAIITGIFVVAATLLKSINFSGRIRANIIKDVKLYNSLPQSSSVKQKLLEHIDAGVERLITKEAEERRSPLGIVLAIIFIAASVYFSWVVLQNGGWWWVSAPLVIFTFLLGAVGFAQDIQKTKRDDKGRPIKK